MKNSLSRFIIKLLKNHKFEFFIMLYASILTAGFMVFSPFIIKLIIDNASNLDKIDSKYLFSLAGLYVLCNLLLSISYRLYDYFVAYKMIPSLRKEIGEFSMLKLLEQSYSFYQNNFAGSLANKVNDLVSNIPEMLIVLVNRFLSNFLLLFFSIIMLWKVNFIFALNMSIWIIIFITGSIILSSRITSLSDDLAEKISATTGRIVDSLSNIISIRLFATKFQEQARIDEYFTKTQLAERKIKLLFFWKWFVYGSGFILLSCVNLYFLIKGLDSKTISLGSFILVLNLNLTVVDNLWQVAQDFSFFSSLTGKSVQALRILEQPIEIKDDENAKELKVTGGEIEFAQVNFFYKGDKALFEDKSVKIMAGEKVGLVGYSGSGKSTFVNLILRLFDINDGKILIDGQDIKKVTQESLRKAIAMIPQDPSLFHRSLYDNISYGYPGANMSQVMNAAKNAHADEFINNLAEGYETLVGERGVKLSGGQRQRIAIARAFIKNAPILILDEATSQLDSLTEEYIQDSLENLMKNRTTIVIAHRLSTLLKMDRIIVFNKGKIVGEGKHNELYKECQLYKDLWDSQIGGFFKNN